MIESRLRSWLNAEYNIEFADGELLVDLPGEKSIPHVLLVNEHGEMIHRQSTFWKSVTDQFDTTARKVRVFAARKPMNWVRSHEAALRRRLMDEILRV